MILPVADMAQADAFWSRLLELEIDPVDETRHYLHTGGAILALVDPREHGGRHRPNPDWLYLRVPDLDATYERARQLGCPPPSDNEGVGIAVRDGGDRSFYSYDPFGNPICFVDDLRSESPPELARYTGSRIANLCKVTLPTTDMARAGAFFEELLGLEADRVVPRRHFFRCDSCELALVNPIEHVAANPDTVYFAVDDLDASWERAQKLRMPPIPGDHPGAGVSTRPWGERSFYGLDPSGNPICFVDDQTLFTGSA